MKVIFIQSTNSNGNLFPKHPHTHADIVLPAIWASYIPVRLTHKINHHSNSDKMSNNWSHAVPWLEARAGLIKIYWDSLSWFDWVMKQKRPKEEWPQAWLDPSAQKVTPGSLASQFIGPTPSVLAPFSQWLLHHGIKTATTTSAYILVDSSLVGKQMCLFSDIPNKSLNMFLTES